MLTIPLSVKGCTGITIRLFRVLTIPLSVKGGTGITIRLFRVLNIHLSIKISCVDIAIRLLGLIYFSFVMLMRLLFLHLLLSDTMQNVFNVTYITD